MSADDLVVRLQATLDETASKAPTLHEDCCGHGRVEFGSDECWCGVPAAILRLVQSHRDILAMYVEAKAQPVVREGREARLRGLDHSSAMGRLTTLGLVLQAIARGYGIEESE